MLKLIKTLNFNYTKIYLQYFCTYKYIYSNFDNQNHNVMITL